MSRRRPTHVSVFETTPACMLYSTWKIAKRSGESERGVNGTGASMEVVCCFKAIVHSSCGYERSWVVSGAIHDSADHSRSFVLCTWFCFSILGLAA